MRDRVRRAAGLDGGGRVPAAIQAEERLALGVAGGCPEILGNGRESGTLRPSDKDITNEAIIMNFKTSYLAFVTKAAEKKADPVAFEAVSRPCAMSASTGALPEPS